MTNFGEINFHSTTGTQINFSSLFPYSLRRSPNEDGFNNNFNLLYN
ncbi:hypothetical protein D082_09770 [Synechocystis sp. PCC 6714]|nr:hypothetical protein D082_09770 [Synechocystis sp. PCC 6714]